MTRPDIFDRWTRVSRIVAVAALVWAVVTPDGVLWNVILASCLIAAVASTVVLVRGRTLPALGQAAASSEAESAVAASREQLVNALRDREGRKP